MRHHLCFFFKIFFDSCGLSPLARTTSTGGYGGERRGEDSHGADLEEEEAKNRWPKAAAEVGWKEAVVVGDEREKRK
jgi:hypothetical protein